MVLLLVTYTKDIIFLIIVMAGFYNDQGEKKIVKWVLVTKVKKSWTST